MVDQYRNYPDLSWALFEICNRNPTSSFEEMSRSLFYYEFLKETNVPHSDHNHPGVEVEPVLEPLRDDQPIRRRVSFQSKYFKDRINYTQIKHSIQKTIQKYAGKLDHLYLFCNETITKTSKQYKEIEQLLRENGITIQPVSNNDIFLLVRKYKDVAQYFFVARGVSLGHLTANVSTMVSIDSSITTAFDSDSVDKGKEELTRTLILEKITECRKAIVEMRLKQAKSMITYILEYDLHEIKEAQALYYYKYLIDLFDGQKATFDKLPTSYKLEGEWIQAFFDNPYEVQKQELSRHYPETQLFVIEKLFTEKKWDYVLELYNTSQTDEFTKEVYIQIQFHAGLSYYNLHDLVHACPILDSLIGVYQDDKYKLFSVCAHIAWINQKHRECQREQYDELIDLLKDLDELCHCDQYKSNELMIATISLEAYYNLGLFDDKFIEAAISKQKEFSEATQNHYYVKYYLALCLEAKCMFDEAIDIYKSLDWKNEDLVASRYMFCLSQKEEFQRAKEIYLEIPDESKSEKVVGVYLHVLEKSHDNDYISCLEKTIQENCDSIEALFAASFYINDKQAFKRYVLPVLGRKMVNLSWDNIPFYIKAGLLLKFSQFGLFKQMEQVLVEIQDLHMLDQHIVNEIYKSFASFSNRQFNKHEKTFSADKPLDQIDLMSARFITEGLMPKQFLTVRYLCAGAAQKPYSMLKFARDIYDLEPQLWVARSIVAILAEQGEKRTEAYSPYINALKDSHVPDHCIVVSYALRRQGQDEMADYYIYKALYYLNDKEDYTILRNCFSFAISDITRGAPEEKTDSIREKTIVVLQNNRTKENSTLCIDSESELNDANNHSFGAIHVNSGQWEHTKLLGKKLQHKVTLHQDEYTVLSIESRKEFVCRYIFKKLQDNPDKFKGVAWVVSAKDGEEFIAQLKALTNRKDQIKSLVESYDFRDNSLGLPIDAFIFGDYSRYIDALRMLLFVKDLIYHAGQPIVADLEAEKFVPSISTLVLASQMGWLDYLTPLQKDFFIPESYSVFFRERYLHASISPSVSPGTMYFQDDQVFLVEQDKKLPEIWENIIEFCEKCSYCSVSTDERINLVFGKDISGEKLMTGFKLDVAQLDAIILAQKKNSIYICDDLFFRKLASTIQVKNINFVSIMLHYQDSYLYPTLNALAKTNYFLVPFLTSSDEEATQRFKDNMNGQRKAKHYGQYFMNLSNLVRSLFSYNDSDEEHTDEIDDNLHLEE